MAKTFIKGAAILGAAGVVTKILGFIFRIPLVSMISAQAMAFYNPAYYIYIFFRYTCNIRNTYCSIAHGI